MRSAFVLGISCAVGACCPAASAPHAVTAPVSLATLGAPGLAVLSPARFEKTTRDLASDAMEGRGTGTPGGAKAEQYVADQFAALGLEPAGEGGTYFQTVPLRSATRVDAETSFVVHSPRGTDVTFAPEQILVRPDPRSATISLDAPLVFVGYGIGRPELGYDDLAGVDLHGAIVVVMGGAPRSLAGKELEAAHHAVLADATLRSRLLRDHGASAVIVVYDPVRAQRMPFAEYISKLVGSGLAWLENGQPASRPVLPSAVIEETSFDRMLAAVPGAPTAHALWEQLDRGERVTPIQLGTASLRVRDELQDVTARNVIARIPGADPRETVVYTAHLDHLGIGPAIDGDTIYNGAVDNAMGVAAMLEVARAFKALPAPPRRSIVFIALTGEEKGLLGSDYFVEHPTLPLRDIIANINIDGVTANVEVHDIVALGAEHSSLATQAAAAADTVKLVVSPDPDPAQVYFVRSDQFSFVRHGIPALFSFAGNLDAQGGTAAYMKISDDWAAQHYHRPSDEWRPEYRADWALPEMRFHFLVGLAVATAPQRPTWNPGDVFGAFVKTPLR